MSEPEEITFRIRPALVGQVTLVTTEEETRLLFTGRKVSDGSPVAMTAVTRSRRVRREEILAVRGSLAERLRVAFLEDVTFTDQGGVQGRTVGSFAGNTYEIERKDERDGLSVYDAGGARVPLDVATQVAGLYRDFGRATSWARLPVGPQRVGQNAPEVAEAMAAGVAGAAAISRVEAPEATLAEIRPGPGGALHGLYRLSLKVGGESQGSLIRLDLKGTLLLRDVDGAPLEVGVGGPLRSEPAPGAGNLPGASGEFRMTQTMAYGRA